MRSFLTTVAAAAVAAALAGPSLASDQASDQLAANAGLTAAQAGTLSLTDVAQAKFNRDTENAQTSVAAHPATAAARATLAANAHIPAATADGLTLSQIAAAKFSRESDDAGQSPAEVGAVALSTRSVDAGTDRSQLIANARLDADTAAQLSLTEIAQVKFDRDGTN